MERTTDVTYVDGEHHFVTSKSREGEAVSDVRPAQSHEICRKN